MIAILQDAARKWLAPPVSVVAKATPQQLSELTLELAAGENAGPQILLGEQIIE
jgi:hypothetical protein